MRERCTKAVAALVGYLRFGQPPDAPATGYSPLLALVPRRLAADEISVMAGYFAPQAAAVSDVDIAVAIMTYTDDVADRADIDRVRRSLSSSC